MNVQRSRLLVLVFLVDFLLTGFSAQTIRAQRPTPLTSFKFTDDKNVDSQKALSAYHQAVEKHRQGKDLEAIADLKQAVALNPGFAEAYNSLCVVYDALNQQGDAISNCQHAIALKSDYVPAFYNLGLVLESGNHRADAITNLKHVITLDPGYAAAHYHLGQLYDKDGLYELAQESLKRAIAVRPEYASAYNELGFSYSIAGRFDEAIAAFREAVRLAPGEAHFQGNLGTAHYLAGHYPEAIASLSRAIDQKPDLQIAQNNLGEVYLKTSQYPEAINCFRRAIDLGSDTSEYQPGIYNDLAAAYAHLTKYKKAAEFLAKAIQLKPDFGTAIYNLGVVDLMVNDKAGAYQQYVALKSLNAELAEKLYTRMFGAKILQVKPAVSFTESP